VGPDGDVFFGVYGNPDNGSRGFLLHFTGDLSVQKTPGGFGWDNTASIVPSTMVPSYAGTSPYLLFTKYNNYANAGKDPGDGVNRIALLDPNATQIDAHPSSGGLLVMREVLTVIGPTPDDENRSNTLPLAVREWCINTAAVNPATHSVFMPSEDGHIYRWNLDSNSLDQFLQLNEGIGEPYVPTIIGPDGQVFTLNGGTLSAMGDLSGVGVTLTSSNPDVRNVTAGQSLTYTVAVTKPGTAGLTPTGTVTIQDTVYSVPRTGVLSTATTTLGANIALVNGTATMTTSALTADRHFLTARYSGDANSSAGNASLVQFIHTAGSSTVITSTVNSSGLGQAVTFTATVTVIQAPGTPTGMVTFQDGSTVLGQVPLGSSGAATFTTAALESGSHTVTAIYASDSNVAASSGSTTQIVLPPTPSPTRLRRILPPISPSRDRTGS
jgi:Bacterial Ig-like domain (group 3)